MRRSIPLGTALLAFACASLPTPARAQFMEETPEPASPAPPPAPSRPQPWVAPPPPPPAAQTPITKPRPAAPAPGAISADPGAPPPPRAASSGGMTRVAPPPPPPATPAPRPVTIAPPPPPPGPSLPRSNSRTPLDEEGLDAWVRPPPPRHAAPFMKVGYRRLSLKNLDLGQDDFAVNAFELDMYPLSRDWVRIASEFSLGAASGTLQGKGSTNLYTTAGWALGFQYPMRVTPFVDFRFGAGLLAGDVAGKTAVTWLWHLGLEGGIELYIVERTFLSLAFGWVRPTYRGFDLAKSQASPTRDPDYMDFVGDTYTFRISLGL